jgi:ABC-type branched-subunit amino acid transport system ATPase component
MRNALTGTLADAPMGQLLASQTRRRGEGLGVHFGGLQAVDDVSLVLQAGEVLALIGPNGAGKTTLLNLLSGFVRPTAGDIHIGDRRATGWAPERIARQGVVRTFQDVRLFGHLSVLENVEIGALGTGVHRGTARRRASEMLDLLGLAGRADVRADAISYGEARHVGIARAAAMSPRFLLLDEPAAGLSESEGDELVAMIVRLRDVLGCGVLLVEHDMRVVGALSDRIHVLDSGRTLAVGTVEDVRNNPLVINAYLGREQLNDAHD